MLLYIIIFLVCILLNSTSSKNSIFSILLSCFLLSLMAGCRDLNIGTDTTLYPPVYLSEAKHLDSFIDLFTYQPYERLDRGVLFLFWIDTWFNANGRVAFFLIEAIITFFTFFAFIRMNKYFRTGIVMFSFAFLFLVYNYSLNAMRQECAISISFYAFTYLWEKKWISYLFWTSVAYTFHSSALVTLIIPFFMYISSIDSDIIRTVFVVGSVVSMVLITVIFWQLLDLIGHLGLFNEAYAVRYGEGGGYEGNESLPTILVFLCVVFYFIAFHSYVKNIIDRYTFYILFLILSLYLVTLFLSLLNQYLYRIGLFYQIIIYYFISYILSSKKSIPIMKYLVCLAIFLYWYRHYVFRNSSETIPYTSSILGIN